MTATSAVDMTMSTNDSKLHPGPSLILLPVNVLAVDINVSCSGPYLQVRFAHVPIASAFCQGLTSECSRDADNELTKALGFGHLCT